jgi:hypothetical protein
MAAAPSAITSNVSILIIAEPELLDDEAITPPADEVVAPPVDEAIAPPVDEVVVIIPEEEELPVALALVFETKNQFAARGFPKPVCSTNLARLNPTRFSTDALRFLKIGM